ncbi:MAG TPA: hypothetical protein ENK05_14810 [Gammaproteobacteria bacterium]|nr:hypothetical protein [Gammaproteobacteria bacterium]
MSRLATLSFLVLVLAACSTMGPRRHVKEGVRAEHAAAEVPEDQLLDVWIELFDPGKLPKDEDDARGLSPEIRKAEARYIPVQLRDTLEKTGYWGAVRVVPRATEGAEVLVRGLILASDGEVLRLRITALDATGRQWFDTTYEGEVTPEAYQQAQQSGREAFQFLYNAIANDLARYRATLDSQQTLAIRRVAALRFARDLAADAFSAYLAQDEKGRYSLVRLPAADDPMYHRVSAIRERDFLLIDTLNGHFDNLYQEMNAPYLEWRKARIDELVAMRKLQSEARQRKLMGAAAIIGAIAIEALGNNSTRASTGTLRDVMILGGAYAIKTGMDKASEATIHQDVIEELGASFASEAQPLVVEVEGKTYELTGSAEAQYEKWRGLLKRIYAAETGLPAGGD